MRFPRMGDRILGDGTYGRSAAALCVSDGWFVDMQMGADVEILSATSWLIKFGVPFHLSTVSCPSIEG